MNCLGSGCVLLVSNGAIGPSIERDRIGGIGRESHLKRGVLEILRSCPSFIFVAVIKTNPKTKHHRRGEDLLGLQFQVNPGLEGSEGRTADSKSCHSQDLHGPWRAMHSLCPLLLLASLYYSPVS